MKITTINTVDSVLFTNTVRNLLSRELSVEDRMKYFCKDVWNEIVARGGEERISIIRRNYRFDTERQDRSKVVADNNDERSLAVREFEIEYNEKGGVYIWNNGGLVYRIERERFEFGYDVESFDHFWKQVVDSILTRVNHMGYTWKEIAA